MLGVVHIIIIINVIPARVMFSELYLCACGSSLRNAVTYKLLQKVDLTMLLNLVKICVYIRN